MRMGRFQGTYRKAMGVMEETLRRWLLLLGDRCRWRLRVGRWILVRSSSFLSYRLVNGLVYSG